MFCIHCGARNPDNARFCARCGKGQSGTEITGNTSAVAKRSSRGGEVSAFSQTDITSNHEVMVLYLNQLRTMEYAVSTLNEKIRRFDRDISSLSEKQYYKEPSQLPESSYTWLHYIDGDNVYLIGFFFVIALGVYAAASFIDQFIPIMGGIQTLAATVIAICVIVALCYVIWATAEASDHRQKAEEKYMQDMEKYESNCKAEEIRFAKNTKKKKELQTRRDTTVKNRDEAKRILRKFYDVNILPSQFRNIYAVYYLHEYLSTSYESFESALLHFNLEEIKAKLDRIIWQQEEMILQQAVQISQNDKILAQNKQILEHSIASEKNTAKAAKYAAISAANTEAIAYTNSVIAYELTGMIY